MANLDSILDDLVAANRILAGLNVLDGFLKCNGESYAKAVHCAM